MKKLEKFTEFELKDASIKYAGGASRTCIYDCNGTATGIDIYDEDTCAFYDICGQVIN